MPKLPKHHENLADATIADLRRWWLEVYGHSAPSRLRREFLELAIGFEIQKHAQGGFDRQTREALKGAVSELEKSGVVQPRALSDVSPGTRLVREWNGNRHVVTALESGFEYRGQIHKSLSGVAFAITGAKRSGPLFFGLKRGAP